MLAHVVLKHSLLTVPDSWLLVFLTLGFPSQCLTHVLELCPGFLLTCCDNTCAFRGDCGPSDLPVSLSVHCLDHDAFVFALCQDHKLRMWSYKVSEAWAQGAAPSFSAWVMF